jgi:GntR family transcriptional regulator
MAQARMVDISQFSELEPGSFVPLYVQLAERIEEAIRGSRERLVGMAIPSESECIEYFKVSRPTVRQAMSQLLSQGLITRGRGRGTFVAPQRVEHDLSQAFEDEMRVANRSVRFELLERIVIAPPKNVRKALDLGGAERVEKITRLRLLEGKVFGYEERYVPARFSKRLTQDALRRKAIYSLIREYAEEAPAQFALTIRSIAATAEHARVLGVGKGAPLLSSEHTYFLASQQPVLYGAVLFHGDRYQFTVRTPIRAS